MVPIEKTDVYRMVFRSISDLIDSHELKPGDRLPSERELCSLLNVSRTTVRQGIKVLESMGKVETRMGSGTFVTAENMRVLFGLENVTLDVKFLRELAVSREAIERMIFEEFYMYHKTVQNMFVLKTMLAEHGKELKKTKETDSLLDVGYDFRFERKVAELVDNRILMYQQSQIHKLWSYVWAEMGCVPNKRSVLHSEHWEITRLLDEGTLEQLDEGISKHVNRPWVFPDANGNSP